MITSIRLSEDLELRLLAASDAASLAAAYRRNREHLAPWDPARPEEFYTEPGQAERIAGLLAGYAAGTTLPLLITKAGVAIGAVTISDIVRGPFENGHLGYWIDAAEQGRGSMTRAVSAVIGLAFGTLGLHRLQAGTLLHNTGSQQVLANCGFQRIGVAEKYLRIQNRWQDNVLFQLVAPGD
ncbi:GNAT family N-acetyltransferase [Arthrobacter russicus]|uniref:Ribosomal-protein-alanine N-acetyltransferase n=1 Tax=Arthrobacter russicus TaxID=172040 RepID=A0ABU1JAM2_9MICC|nr:GNAT family protein [Arthrobacter russicus]MDN5668379.1 GNAT family N-acetyltransferase [Renibacterium salmoninarum]MDR6269428.1 ribosomal-protein-alanine N-acetyltransferase [Arthrobacter russicus]